MMNSVQLVCILAMFLCTSKDVLGAYLDFSVSIPSQMQEPKLGDTVIIYCNADSPQTILGWTADGINIVDLTSLAFNTDGNSLTIDSFDKSYDAIYQCIANEIDAATGQLSPPILVSSFENRYFVQQPEIFTAYIVQLAGGMGYEPITFQCELVKIFNGTKPIITWQYIDTEGGDVLNYTDFENAVNNRYIVQYDHIGYFQVHSPTAALNGSRARCVATRPDSPTEVVYSEWASANLIDMVLPDGFDIQPGFEPFSQVPPTVYHVEEGQTSANLPCSSVTGLHSHLLQWEYETEDNIIFISGFILIPSLVGQVSLYADTILTVDVSNDKFVDRTFLCIIRTSDNVPKRATSLIAGPAPPLDPPTVFNSSFDVVTSINSNTTLTYEIQTNDTVVSVWWWKDEVLIPFDADTQSLNGMTATLTIRNTKALDSGLYQVLALTGSRYAFTGETGIFDVTVESAAFITSSTGDIIADNGATVTLEVTAEGTPNNITYEWSKDGVVIPNEVSNTLTIDPISVNDIGEYECIPSNAAGSFNSSIIQVDVKAPDISFDVLTDTAINQPIGPSSVAGYTCTPVIPNGEINTSGDLVINGRLDVADGGTYKCTSAEIDGDIVIELVATASAFITSSTGDIIADNGATVTLEVTAEGTPNDITYEWRKDGVVIPNEVSNTLIIDQISVNDIGEYECIPINAAGSFNSSIIQVDVEVPIQVDGLSDSSTIVAPPTASGYSCIPANPRVQLLPNGTLRTYDLGVTDTGVYMCVANNPDEVRGTITFNVSVFLPAYVAIGVRTVRKRVGEMMALSCNVKGDVLSYVWKKDGIVIPDANQSFYIIYDILKSDIGHYECIPSNAFGTHNTTEVIVNIETELSLDWLTRYEVQLLPSASNGYRCTPPLNRASISNTGLFTTNGLQLIDGNRYRCTSTSFNGTFILVLRITGHTPEAPNLLEPRITEDGLAINITWNMTPSSIKPVTQYILFWRLETEDRDDERNRRQSDDEQSIVTRDTSYNLTDYDREAVYTFWVVAENGAGRSPLSNSEEFDVEVEFNLQFQSSEREKDMRLAGWLIALIVILCLLCCCICCLCWLILCCCLLRKKKVYHAEEEEMKHSEEMEKYRKKGEDEDDEDDEDEDTAGEEEGEITGDNNGDTPGEGDNNGDTPGEGDNNGSTAGGEGDAGDTAGGDEGPDPTGDDTADGTTIEPV